MEGCPPIPSTSMRTDGDSFAKIASELGDGLTHSDIKNRWTHHLKDKLQWMLFSSSVS